MMHDDPAYFYTSLAYHAIAFVLFAEAALILRRGIVPTLALLARAIDQRIELLTRDPSKAAVFGLAVFMNILMFGAFIEACAIDHGNPGQGIATYEAAISIATAVAIWLQWVPMALRRRLA